GPAGCLLPRAPPPDRLPQVLAADVEERRLAPDRERRDRRALQQPMRLPLGDLSVVARARVGLVEVDDDVRWLAGVARDEPPLHACREPRAAAPAETARLHLLDDVGVGHTDRRAQGLVAARGHVAIDPDRLGVAPVARETRLGGHDAGTSS